MLFEMIRARHLGKLVPKWQLGTLPKLRGRLLVSEQHDEQLNRSCRRARFVVDGQRDVPTLSDAVLLWASHDTWVMTGIECALTDSGDQRYYAQTWLLTPVQRVVT